MKSSVIKSSSVPEQVVEALRAVCGPIPVTLHQPKFIGNEWNYVKECLDSTYVSSVGAYVNKFEDELASYTGAKHAIAIVNGTAALHLALLISGVKPNDEVIIPALTFVATANAVTYCGAVPHFADSGLTDLGLDPEALRQWLKHTTEIRNGICVNRHSGRIIRALMPMHVFGHPCDLEGLMSVARDFKLALIEDAAESIGSWYHGRHTGTLGLVGAVSFNGNKTITTGGGGAILTNNPELGKLAKHLSTTAKLPHQWEFAHDQIAYNYRMPNINAALGCAQLEQLVEFLQSKRRLYQEYRSKLSNIPEIRLVQEPDGCISNYWLQAIILREPDKVLRNAILTATNDAGYMTRPAWTLLHKLKPFKDCPRAPLEVADHIEAGLVNIPSSAGLA